MSEDSGEPSRDARSPADSIVRRATPDDELDVRRVLDAAVLSVPSLEERLASDDVLVAVADGRVCGAIVVAPEGPPTTVGEQQTERPADWRDRPHLVAIAVRRRRRDAGLGTALVRAAIERYGPLVADFDADVRPFYESLDATVREGDERCWALVRGASA